MPTYLLHGFRWPRPLIRIHIILQNLDDAAAEWLVAPDTSLTLLKNFHDLYPGPMAYLNRLRFVEQYDPEDTSASAASQPFAYVADVVHEVKLGVAIDEVLGGGIKNEQWSAMMEVRDKLAPEEKLAWYVVVCGDEERWAPPTLSLIDASAAADTLQQNSEGDRLPGNSVDVRPGTRPRLLFVCQLTRSRHSHNHNSNKSQRYQHQSTMSLPKAL